MNLPAKIKAVEKIYTVLDKRTATFKKETGLQCISPCGDCCLKKDIEATVLEFLPAAYQLYKSDNFNHYLSRLEQNNPSVCVFYNPFSEMGFCAQYESRGLICRLFGFSALINKHLNKKLVTCRHIKELADPVKVNKNISKAPEITSYYWQLYGIDPALGMKKWPINTAILKALNIILLHFRYNKKAG